MEGVACWASGTALYPQLNQHSAMVKAIPVRRVEKGQLLEYVLTDLRVPHSYEVRLTPYTTFGAGDMASRIIHYTERRWWGRVGGGGLTSYPGDPSNLPTGFQNLGLPNVQCPTLPQPARPLWSPSLVSGALSPGPNPSLGTLCMVPHFVCSDLLFLLAFSAINSPNLSGETPPSHFPFPLGTQRLPGGGEDPPRDTQRENGMEAHSWKENPKAAELGLEMCASKIYSGA